MVAKPNSLARSLPPTFTHLPLKQHDEEVVRTIEQRLQLSFTGFSREIMQTSIRRGGLGFCSTAEIAPHAFTAGMASSMALLANTNLSEHGHAKVSTLPRFQQLEHILQSYRDSPIKFEDHQHFRTLQDFILFYASDKHSKKLQSRIMATIRGERMDRLQKEASPEQWAHLTCRANKDSALVWKAFPLTREHKLTDDESRFLVTYATGCELPGLPKECVCACKNLTVEHLVHCAGKLHRHNMLQRRLVAFAREQGFTVQQNERLTIEDIKEKQEPDIIFYGGVKPLETDVTVVNPCAPSRVKRTAKRPHYAIETANAIKRRRYDVQALARNNDFAPLAFETHGAMGDEVHKLLQTLAAKTRGVQGWAAKDMALDLAVTLAKGNALCASLTIARAQRQQDQLRTS